MTPAELTPQERARVHALLMLASTYQQNGCGCLDCRQIIIAARERAWAIQLQATSEVVATW